MTPPFNVLLLVPIATALIAAGIAYLGLILTKESKVSEFRQHWIDSLREEIAAAISDASSIANAISAPYEGVELWEKNKIIYSSYSKNVAKVKLRLNAKEDEAQKLLTLFKQLSDILDKGPAIEHDALTKLLTSITDSASDLLKKEWERVKKGESIYRNTKRLVASLGSVGLVVFLYWLAGALGFVDLILE